MKKSVTVLFLFVFGVAFSQLDRRIGQNQSSVPTQSAPKKVDFAELTLTNLKKELALDGFQEAVVMDILKTHFSKRTHIIESDVIDEEKADKLKVLQEKLDKDINEILTAEQKEKFNALKEKANKKKKKRD
jgi:hypothetical protein